MFLRNENPVEWIFQKIDALAVIALAALYGYGVFLILSGEPKVWVDLITDDGYYYLGVVRGLVEDGSSSFLPPFETNGYQPLWVLLLVASAFVFGTSDASLALQMYSMCYGFIALFAAMSKRMFGFAFPAIASAGAFYGATLEGMETAMIPVFVLGLFHSRSWPAKGLFSSLIFLTRLDALALVIARDAYFFIFRRDRDLRHYLILVPVAAAYFALNHFIFGVPVPVSGLAKAVGSVTGENLGLIYLHVEHLAAPALLMLSVIAFSAVVKGRMEIPFKDELIILLVTLAVVCAYYSLRSGWLTWPWYFWPQMMLFFYATTSGALLLLEQQESSGTEPARYFIAAAATVAFFSYAMVPAKEYALSVLHHGPLWVEREASFAEKNLELVELIKSRGFPEGTFFAMGDRAGSFGFFLGRRYNFIQTEGLVGPYSYYESMKSGNGEKFLVRHGVNYLIAERDRFFEEGEIIGVVEPVQPLSSRFGQYLTCFRKSEVVVDQTYLRNSVSSKRYLLDFSRRTACPASMVSHFEELRRSYGQLRKFMLYSEYRSGDGWTAQGLNRAIPDRK
jgi:hypothetical protein